MGCCATTIIQSKSEAFLFKILESTLLSSYDFIELKNDLETHFVNNPKKTATLSEASVFISQNFYDLSSKDIDLPYHVNIFKSLIRSVYKAGNSKSPETQSIYYIMLLVFPLLKEKILNQKVNVDEKYKRLFKVISLVCLNGNQGDITFSQLREIIFIYLKAILYTIFKALYDESKKHILSEELTKDLEYHAKKVFTESNVEAFINEHFLKKNKDVKEDQIVKENTLHEFVFNEVLFFSDLIVFFIEFVNHVNVQNRN